MTLSYRHARAALLFVCCLSSASALPAATGKIRYVNDGDTFRLMSGERIRIADIDAPESRAGQAKCPAELARGKAATRQAKALLDGKTVRFERTGRSYNRTVARLTLDGRDLAARLISIGAARPWLRRQPKPDWYRAR